jgi:tight adherence protein B
MLGGGAVKRVRPGVEEVASTVERLAALLGAGVAPRSAWKHLAEADGGGAVGGIAVRIRAGDDMAVAIASAAEGRGAGSASRRRPRARRTDPQERAAWLVLAVAWAVADESGAPFGRCLTDLASALTQVGMVQRDVAAALAGPRATARMVTALPLVTVLGGSLIGLDPLRVLLGTPLGGVCLAGGLLLLLLSRLWTGRLIARSRSDPAALDLDLDLLAVAVGGGGSIENASMVVAHARARLGAPDGGGGGEAAERILLLAARAGAAPADLLRGEAARRRRDAIGIARADAAALGVWLMLPLGLCVLPAFLLLSVAPVFLGVLAETAAI